MASSPALFDWEPLPVEAPPAPKVDTAQAMVLYTEYDRWACKIAHRHRRPGRDIEDLVQLARIGLWKAATRYRAKSAAQPVHFSVFARKFVDGEILMATRRGAAVNESMKALEEVREPSYSMGEVRTLPKGSPLRWLATMLQAGYTCEEIAAILGVMVCDLERAVQHGVAIQKGKSR